MVMILARLPGLTSLLAEQSGFGEMTCQYVIEHRANQMEELNVIGRNMLQGDAEHKLLTSCPNLVRFIGGRVDVKTLLPPQAGDADYGTNVGSHMRGPAEGSSGGNGVADLQVSEWACKGLRELELDIDGFFAQEDPGRLLKALMTQIGKMTKLEVLTIHIEDNRNYQCLLDFNPEGESTRQLRGLQRLPVLSIDAEQWHPHSRESLDCWMNQWPRLEYIQMSGEAGFLEHYLRRYLDSTYPNLTLITNGSQWKDIHDGWRPEIHHYRRR